jgi:TonB family protein
LAANVEPTWDDVREQVSWFEKLLPIRRTMRSRNRSQAMSGLDAEYGPKRAASAQAAKKDEFETTAQYLARTAEARATFSKLEAEYKAERDKLEIVFKDPTGDPDLRALESIKSQRFRGPCNAEWLAYDADTETLTLFVGGADRTFRLPIAEAKAFKPRSSKLTCEGGLTPESVAVSDPFVKLVLMDAAPIQPYKIGSGVSAPGILFRVEPEYSEEARVAKFQGSVILRLIVDINGLPRSIRVERSLGMGLDEKAMQAVRKWRFRPGLKDGVAVPVESTVEINFRLL